MRASHFRYIIFQYVFLTAVLQRQTFAHDTNLMYENNAYYADRYVHIISAGMLTKIVYTVTITAHEIKLIYPPLRNLRVMHLRISNFRYRYLHAVSISPLHNTYTLRSCASYSPERRQETLCLYHVSCRRVCLTFLFAISTCHSYQTWLSR